MLLSAIILTLSLLIVYYEVRIKKLVLAKKERRHLEKWIEALEIRIEELDSNETKLINEHNEELWRLNQQIRHLEEQLDRFRAKEKL